MAQQLKVLVFVELRFCSQHPYDGSQSSITPVPGVLTLLLNSIGTEQARGTYLYM